MVHDWLYLHFFASGFIQRENYKLYLDPRDRIIAKKLALYGEYEPHVQRLLLELAGQGTTVIDIGANVGLFTIPLGIHVGPKGTVYAFEPDPDNYALLLQNIAANSLKNVMAVNKALSDTVGYAKLYQNKRNRGMLSLNQNNVQSRDDTLLAVEVQVVTGDSELCKISGPVSVVKIDVEGAEPLVLKGMSQFLNGHPETHIVVEYSPKFIKNFGIDPLDFLEKLRQKGYILNIVEEKRVVEMEPISIFNCCERLDNSVTLLALKMKR